MKKILSILLLTLVLISIYPLATWLALNVYQDDPAAMVWTDREAYNRKFITGLVANSGMTQDLVQKKLAGPDISEAYQKDQNLYQLAYYRTQRDISDGITTRTECTALLYRDRQLIAIGDEAVKVFRQSQPARTR